MLSWSGLKLKTMIYTESKLLECLHLIVLQVLWALVLIKERDYLTVAFFLSGCNFGTLDAVILP